MICPLVSRWQIHALISASLYKSIRVQKTELSRMQRSVSSLSIVEKKMQENADRQSFMKYQRRKMRSIKKINPSTRTIDTDLYDCCAFGFNLCQSFINTYNFSQINVK